MRILFRPQRPWQDLRRILLSDGWTLEGSTDGVIVAEHPHVGDEPAARSRLHRIALLTSGRLRIEFLPRRASPPTSV
jgi:hypothetical protein